MGCNKEQESSVTKKTQNDNTDIEQPDNSFDIGDTSNPDGSKTIDEGYISEGFRDSVTDEIIDSGTLLKPIDDKIKGYISFEQNISEKKDYRLIVMIDYIQQDFKANGIEYQSYPFSLEGNESIKIDIELPYPENSKEFCYMIVFSPDMTDFFSEGEYVWDNIYEVMQCLSSRFLLSKFDYKEDDYLFDEALSEKTKDIDLICDLIKNPDIYKIMPTCNSGENIFLVLGDDSIEYSDTCAVVAFLNWEQVPIKNEEEKYKLVKLKKDKILTYEITVPEVTQSTPYQIFIFPSPFMQDEFQYSIGNATPRTIINKNEKLEDSQ